MTEFILIYALIINLMSFFLMGEDKRRAVNDEYRISESKFMFLAFIGGSLGIMAGMYYFLHKTLHKKFTVGVPMILILQTLAGMAIVVFSNI